MATTYDLREGDEIDRICFDHYGFTDGSVEAVLRANHDVLDLFDNQGRVQQLDSKVSIVLPDLSRPVGSMQILRIFD